MKLSTYLSAATLGLGLLWSSAALADVPPPDTCETQGAPCNNAPPNYDSPGTCQAKTCSKTLPDGDGGFATHEYPCKLCVADNGSAGASGSGNGNAGAAGSGNGSAGAAGKGSSSDSGCSLSQADGGAPAVAALAVAGLGALLLGRRKR